MGFSGTVAIRAMKDSDYQATVFPGTTAGLQAAIDYLAGGKGTVQIGPGTLGITTVVSIHSGCHVRGSGVGSTVIQRASGSLASGDAAYTGCTFFASPYGSNGVAPTGTATAQSDITISDMTIDGNSSAFGSVNPATPRHMAAYIFWTDRLRLERLHVKNFLQCGFYTDACRNSVLRGIRLSDCGQYASPSARNSISISNTQATSIADGYSTNFVLSDIVSSDPGDHHIDVANCNNVTVSNLIATGGYVVLEVEGDTTRTTEMRGFTYSNVVAEGNKNQLFVNNISSGVDLRDVLIQNCYMKGHASQHSTQAVVISQSTKTGIIYNFHIDNCVFYNINSIDATALGMIDLKGGGATPSYDVKISNCTFVGGAAASTRTNCHGLEVETDIRGLHVSNCTFRTVAGVGVYLHPFPGQTIADVSISGVLVDTSNSSPFQFVENANTNGILKDVICVGCIGKDGCRQTGQVAFYVGALSASGGGAVSNVSVRDCLAYRTSGTEPSQGLRMEEGAGGTTSAIQASGNDFSQLSQYHYVTSGTLDGSRIDFSPGRGTDIASAATISIPTDGSVFHITGSTNITNGITVKSHDNGRVVSLIFDSTPTLSDTGTSKLAGDFAATADDTITLRCDGANWYEVARSVN